MRYLLVELPHADAAQAAVIAEEIEQGTDGVRAAYEVSSRADLLPIQESPAEPGQPGPPLHMLSDYAWRILAYLAHCPEGKAAASDVSMFGNIGETDRAFIFGQLACGELLGLTGRTRDDMRGPWLWSLTPNGHAALEAHGES